MVLRKFLTLFTTVMLAGTLAVAQDSKDSKDDDSFYHNAGINDLDAIGRRNVGCNRGLFNWYSLDSQVKMGQQFAQQVEQTSHLITDPVVNEYVNRLGQN